MTVNKIALVTGSSRGLGRDMALQLARRGVDVIVTYRSSESEAQKVVETIEGIGTKAALLPLDVADTASFVLFIDKLKAVLATHWQRERFDFLINNAGVGINTPLIDFTEAQFDQLYQVHFKGVFFLTQGLLPYMADGGRIINISSGLTRFCYPGYGIYAAMKGAMEILTKYLAKELAERRIRVNAIAPGAVETDFGGGIVRDNQDINDYIATQTTLGRVALPEDIGGAIALLLADESHWINAQRIEISGGMFL